MQSSPKIELSGVLSRCTFGDTQVEVRLSPFDFSLEPDGRPVWSLVFLEPNFEAAAVQAHLDNEVDIEVFDERAILYDVWRETQQVLGAAKLTVEKVSLDTGDLHLYIRKLETKIEHLHGSLRAARTKDDQGRVILRELLRRAEIKAAASEHLRERHVAAIEVLKRLRVHFDD